MGPDNPFRFVPEDLWPLIPGYLERREKEIPELIRLSDEKQFGALKEMAHKLKGSGTSYGFDKITEIARELETTAMMSNSDKVRELIEQLSLVITSLKDFQGKNRSAS